MQSTFTWPACMRGATATRPLGRILAHARTSASLPWPSSPRAGRSLLAGQATGMGIHRGAWLGCRACRACRGSLAILLIASPQMYRAQSSGAQQREPKGPMTGTQSTSLGQGGGGVLWDHRSRRDRGLRSGRREAVRGQQRPPTWPPGNDVAIAWPLRQGREANIPWKGGIQAQ